MRLLYRDLDREFRIVRFEHGAGINFREQILLRAYRPVLRVLNRGFTHNRVVAGHVILIRDRDREYRLDLRIGEIIPEIDLRLSLVSHDLRAGQPRYQKARK